MIFGQGADVEMVVAELTHAPLRMQNHRAAAAVVAADGGAANRRICHIGSEIGVGNVSPGTDGPWTNDPLSIGC